MSCDWMSALSGPSFNVSHFSFFLNWVLPGLEQQSYCIKPQTNRRVIKLFEDMGMQEKVVGMFFKSMGYG